MKEAPEETMVEEREELMISPTGGSDPTRRIAHFLKPTANGTATDLLPTPPPLSFPSPTFDPQKWPLKVCLKGWRCPGKDWPEWVDSLLPKYRSVWEQAGIYEAILSSTHKIQRDDDLVCGIVERWCSETKSFVFVWGEATITLEDVTILGGFSVIGQPVCLPCVTTGLKEVEERLAVARKEIGKSPHKKATLQCWLRKFKGSGSDNEHEAFLVFWLSKFIFPNGHDSIRSSIFSIAIHLACGTRIALAPAVLAAIYRDLTLWRQVMSKFDAAKDDVFALILCSPFQLVQMWAWERFPEVQPVPNVLKEADTRSARWHLVNKVRVENVRSVLDSAGETFLWRPYTIGVPNWQFHKFYQDHGGWVLVDSAFDDKLVSFTQYVRVSQLVGLGFMEQYLPHRVAMQFGMDQDLPSDISLPDETSRIAWSNYCKPTGKRLYISSRLFESDVTTRYLEWWKQSVVGHLDAAEGVTSSKRSKHTMSDTPNVLETATPCNGHDNLDKQALGDGENPSHCSEIKPITGNGNDGNVEGSTYEHRTTELELEARVSKLEVFIAKLKAAKLGHGPEKVYKTKMKASSIPRF